jgi:hypothetical protein
MPSNAMRTWVVQILGVSPADDPAALRALLAGLSDSLKELRTFAAPELATLVASLRDVSAKLDAPDAAAQVEALRSAIVQALRAARQKEASASPRVGVDVRQLLVRWQTAQSAVTANITSLGQAVLARDDVRNDPRLPQVEAAVASLPGLVPAFGPSLQALFDTAIGAGSVAGIKDQALVVVADYRKTLADAKDLLSLEEFAAKDMGSKTPLVTTLADVLGEIEQELKAA